jgi:hypothetical protein
MFKSLFDYIYSRLAGSDRPQDAHLPIELSKIQMGTMSIVASLGIVAKKQVKNTLSNQVEHRLIKLTSLISNAAIRAIPP